MTDTSKAETHMNEVCKSQTEADAIPTPAEIAASLRTLADQIEAGDFRDIKHTDETESVVAGVHKGCIVRVTTGKRVVTLELQTKNYRPVEIAGILDLAEAAWVQTGGPERLRILCERIGPRARVETPTVEPV